MGYPVDVKTTNLTADGAIFAGPCRILGFYYVSDTTAGSIVIKDGGASGTTVATFQTPLGANSAGNEWATQVFIPGNGLYCRTSGYADLTGVDKVTFFYG
jgi:hypothetical protein|tara:strand:- start:529 stop:828 length:300 start_codon:yes stop_codon:yes gene_type:complete